MQRAAILLVLLCAVTFTAVNAASAAQWPLYGYGSGYGSAGVYNYGGYRYGYPYASNYYGNYGYGGAYPYNNYYGGGYGGYGYPYYGYGAYGFPYNKDKTD